MRTEVEYWDESSMLAESLIILNVPITAFFLSIWFYRRKMFFADHFIFALFLYSFVLLFSHAVLPCRASNLYALRALDASGL